MHVRVRGRTAIFATNDQGDMETPKKKKKGYQFGDITKNLVSKVTKKDDYEFGDISKSIDKTVKEKVATLSGKDKDSYEFGDLSRLLDSRVKEQLNDFTNQTSYEFGDISKEILKRVKSRDYTIDDMFFLFKVLLAFGAGISPIASFLPAKLLIQLLDYSIIGDVSNRVATAVSEELDRRMKKAFTGDPDYKLGDMSKKAVLNYIGKEEYTFGDITNFVVDSVGERKENERIRGEQNVLDGTSDAGSNAMRSTRGILDGIDSEAIAKELEEWDKKFIVDAEIVDIKTNSKTTK